MPVVPFAPQAPKRNSLPKPDDPWVLMAAATMDNEGRLVEQPQEPKEIGDRKDGT